MWTSAGPWFWYPSGTVGLISIYAWGYCLVGRLSDDTWLGSEQISAFSPSKFQHHFLFSLGHAPKQGSPCLRLQKSMKVPPPRLTVLLEWKAKHKQQREAMNPTSNADLQRCVFVALLTKSLLTLPPLRAATCR